MKLSEPGTIELMTPSAAPPDRDGSVWTRPAPIRRVPQTRAAIVAAAIRVADAEGLTAVTVRRLADELDARPMSIYSYARVDSKEELLALMVDEVCAEMLVSDLPEQWRPALQAVALRTRAALLAHPWWIELIGRNVLLGPHATRYREQTLTAVRTLDADQTIRQAAIVSVQTYVVGQITFALDELGSAEAEHRLPEQSQLNNQYYQQLIATGDFPHLSGSGPPEPTSAAERDRLFTLGLGWLLAGIEAGANNDDASQSSEGPR